MRASTKLYETGAHRGGRVLGACQRRKFHDLYQAHRSPVAKEALDRIAQVVRDRERDSRTLAGGKARRPAGEVAAAAGSNARLVEGDDVEDVAEVGRGEGAIHYALERWRALVLFCEDGRVEMDNNAAERSLRAVALGRKNYLFAGSMPAENARPRSTVCWVRRN